jgi:type IV secretion system protein VirD4
MLFKKMTSFGLAAGEMMLRDVVDNVKHTIEAFDDSSESVAFGNLDDVATDDPNGMTVDGIRSLRPEYPNVILFGSTGGFKSSVVATQLLRANGPTFIVHNPANTMFPLVAPRLNSLGYDIHNFDFSDLMRSSGLNLIDLVKCDEDASRLSEHLFRDRLDGDKSDPFFNLTASALVSLLIRMTLRMDKKYHTIANIRHMLDALIAKNLHKVAVRYCKEDMLFNEYKGIIANNSEKTLGSIILTAQSALNYWTSEEMCRLTARSSVDLDSLRAKKQVIFLSTSNYDAIFYRKITSLIIDQAMRALMRKVPPIGSRPVYFLIDECDTLNLSSLGKQVSNTRKYFIYNYLIYQNIGQLQNNFSKGEAQNILANCSRLHFGHQDFETSRELAETLGKQFIQGKDGKTRTKYLMDAHELLTMPKSKGILLCRNRAYPLDLHPWFLQPMLKRQAGGEYEFKNPYIPDKVDLIPLT